MLTILNSFIINFNRILYIIFKLNSNSNLIMLEIKKNKVGRDIILPSDSLSLLKNFIFKRKIRIKEFFKDFDPLNKSVISIDRFKTILNCFDIFLNEKDLNSITEKYKIDKNNVNYMNFVNEINEMYYNPEVLSKIREKCTNKIVFTKIE